MIRALAVLAFITFFIIAVVWGEEILTAIGM
jgi:hypothetical protein